MNLGFTGIFFVPYQIHNLRLDIYHKRVKYMDLPVLHKSLLTWCHATMFFMVQKNSAWCLPINCAHMMIKLSQFIRYCEQIILSSVQ